MKKKELAIIGGGSVALFLANALDTEKYRICIYEKNKAFARKFLVAGDGGLNLTHSESPEIFISRFHPDKFISKAFSNFSNEDFIQWLNSKGIQTFKGSSGRIFPVKGIKPIQVLDTLLQSILNRGVNVFYSRRWNGFDKNNNLVFSGPDESVHADIVVFCLGGATWSVTGSDGEWTPHFSNKGIRIEEFEASNCSFMIDWPSDLALKIEGKPLKNVKLNCGDISRSGEVVLKRNGIEGSGIYPFSPQIRAALKQKGTAEIQIDFKPQMSMNDLLQKISVRSQASLSEVLRNDLHLSSVQISLLKAFLSKEEFNKPAKLAEKIKKFPLFIKGLGPLEDAISSVGGIGLDEITADFELKKLPGHYAIGEMLDYDAPTGGYLLQSCFSMAMQLAAHLNKLTWVNLNKFK